MHARPRALRCAAAAVGLAIVAVSVVGCSKPLLGYGFVARNADGALAVLVVACRGAVTDLTLTRYEAEVDGKTEADDVVTWSGSVEVDSPTSVALTVPGDWLTPGALYQLQGSGTDSSPGDRSAIQGQFPLTTAMLESLPPGQALVIDESEKFVAVPANQVSAAMCDGPLMQER